ncbi:hypothetical protein B7494_g4052 [Chlorociboria aeruginascens]|nr:hypothetical protein B7494_g4052 [Chlorociboria aeruginascens]
MRTLRSSSLFQGPYAKPSSKFQFITQIPSLHTTPFSQHRSVSSTVSSQAPLTHNQYKDQINGPSSTRPAPLDLPIRGANERFFFKYAFQLGKAYASFYKIGVKNIYTNFRAARTIQDTVDSHRSLSLAISSNALSRSEFQLLTRSGHDIRRIPMFALVYLVCGEFTPLVVLAITSVVPWTYHPYGQLSPRVREKQDRVIFGSAFGKMERENRTPDLEIHLMLFNHEP